MYFQGLDVELNKTNVSWLKTISYVKLDTLIYIVKINISSPFGGIHFTLLQLKSRILIAQRNWGSITLILFVWKYTRYVLYYGFSEEDLDFICEIDEA